MKGELKKIIDMMKPEEVLPVLTELTLEVLPQQNEQARVDFIVGLLGESGSEKIASLVDL